MAENPISAYQDVEKNALEGRELEASVLLRAAAMLANVKNCWDSADRDALLDEALRFNQRLWGLFQVEVSSPENPLPPELKANLVALSMYVDKRIFETMAYPAADKLDILIKINQNIAAGLKEGVGADQPGVE